MPPAFSCDLRLCSGWGSWTRSYEHSAFLKLFSPWRGHRVSAGCQARVKLEILCWRPNSYLPYLHETGWVSLGDTWNKGCWGSLLSLQRTEVQERRGSSLDSTSFPVVCWSPGSPLQWHFSKFFSPSNSLQVNHTAVLFYFLSWLREKGKLASWPIHNFFIFNERPDQKAYS
jgi:hypothetical protein